MPPERTKPRRAPRRLFVLAAAAAVFALALATRERTEAAVRAQAGTPAVIPASPAHRDALAVATASPRREAPAPAARRPAHDDRGIVARSSLRGTQPDGAIALDATGLVRVDRALRRRFDWYLALAGELDAGAIRALFGREVESAHGIAVAAQAMALFDRYVDALRAASMLPADAPLPERLVALQALRERLLGAAMAEAFYGDEEREAAAALERMARRDRAEARAAPLREAETAGFVALHDASLARAGASDAERHAERSELWGEHAAQRLAVLDAERARWRARLAEYRLESDAIRADARLDAATRERAVASLRASLFDAHERMRVEALEAVGRLPGG